MVLFALMRGVEPTRRTFLRLAGPSNRTALGFIHAKSAALNSLSP
jgi:hypothetical protein